MVTLGIRYAVLYAIFTFLTVNSLCNQNFLNCNTGVSLFFQYTSVAFNLSILTTLLAVMLYKRIVMSTAVIMIVALLQQTSIQADRFVNTSLVNIGLMNPLGQYHPPMFFAASFILVYKIFNQKKFYLTLPTNLLLTSLVLSGWWANQELFWGTYWNWDPVEMSSLLLLTSLLILLHLFKKYLSLGILNAPHSTVITTTVLVVYTINRSDLANSVHKFSGTLLLNLDKPNLLLIKILLVVGITTLVLITIYNTPWQKLVGFIKLLALFIICTVVIIYCKLNEVFSVGFTDLPKWFITSLTTLIYISSSYKNIRTYINRVPKYWAHKLVFITAWCVFFFKTPPSTNLYSLKIDQFLIKNRVSCLNMVQASNGITNNYVYIRDFAQKKKHQTLINTSTSLTNLRIFKKINSDVFFTTISPQNYTNTSWLLVI